MIPYKTIDYVMVSFNHPIISLPSIIINADG